MHTFLRVCALSAILTATLGVSARGQNAAGDLAKQRADRQARTHHLLELSSQANKAEFQKNYAQAEKLLQQMIDESKTGDQGDAFWGKVAEDRMLYVYDKTNRNDKTIAIIKKRIEENKRKFAADSWAVVSEQKKLIDHTRPGPDKEAAQHALQDTLAQNAANRKLTQSCLAVRERALREMSNKHLSKAEQQLQTEALPLAEKLGPHRAELAFCLSEIAAIKQSQKKFADASALLARANNLVDTYKSEYCQEYSQNMLRSVGIEYTPRSVDLLRRRIEVLQALGRKSEVQSLQPQLAKLTAPVVFGGFGGNPQISLRDAKGKTVPGVVFTLAQPAPVVTLEEIATDDLDQISKYRDVFKKTE